MSNLNYESALTRGSDLQRLARSHPLAAIPPRERRLSAYGSRLLGRIREQGRTLPPHPAPQS